MPGKFDRDRAADMERLLEQTMRAELGPPTAECLDAERLAAWSDGALSAIEGFDVEQHLSTCERCQAMLAAFVRVTGEAPEAAVVLPFWRRPATRWIAPVAAAAAAAGVIWFVMPRSATGPVPTTQMARVEQQPQGPAAESTSGPGAASNATDSTTKARERAATGAAREQPSAPAARRPADGTAATDVTMRGRADERSQNMAPPEPTSATAASKAAPAASSSSMPAVGPVESSQHVTVTAEVTPVQTASSRVTAAPPMTLAARPAGGVIEINPRSMTTARAQADAAAGVVRETPARTRWQIRPDGTVVRIVGDAGTPEPVTLSPPARVIAGDAASPSECWLIGPAGTVWLSTDGLHFDRVTPPASAELRTIVATSGRQATVATNDGRRFVTTDAGATWRALP